MLDDRQARLCRLFASIVLGEWDEVRRLRREAPPGEPDRGWRETLLMVHLFAGVPRTIEAFDNLRDVGGVGTPSPEEVFDELDNVTRGEPMFRTIYGKGADGVQAHLHSHHPDLAKWVLGHAYGRVLSRPGLDPALREMLAVAALASLGQDRQLASHARGAVRCGAEPESVAAVLDVLPDQVPADRLDRARTVVARFTRSG